MSDELIERKKAVLPAQRIEDLLVDWERYQSLKEKLRKPGDFVKFETSEGPRDCPTKFWRGKLRKFFGTNLEIVERWIGEEMDGTVTYHRRARATDPITGVYQEAEGACNMNEKIRTLDQIIYSIKQMLKRKKKKWSEDFIKHFAQDKLREEIAKAPHNASTHAETRAKNRVVFEMVGFGEVSAEEMPEDQKINKEQDVENVDYEVQKEKPQPHNGVFKTQYLTPNKEITKEHLAELKTLAKEVGYKNPALHIYKTEQDYEDGKHQFKEMRQLIAAIQKIREERAMAPEEEAEFMTKHNIKGWDKLLLPPLRLRAIVKELEKYPLEDRREGDNEPEVS